MSVQLIFYGADKAVTGSCHCLEVGGKKLLVDCGLQQGADEDDNSRLPFSPADLECVLVTHAHIDHSGRLPLLVKQGFHGKVYATSATCKLLSVMLRDSAHIQEMDAINENRKDRRAGREPAEPLYSIEDAMHTAEFLSPCEYGDFLEPMEGVRCRFTDAGHLLGSSCIEVWAKEGGVEKKIVFSGDIGNSGQPILRDPQYIREADYVVMESTYGDREHQTVHDYTEDLAALLNQTLSAGGNVVIPSFAVGRTQELLYCMREIKERKLVRQCPDFPVYVDSPLAAEATAIYSTSMKGYADEETDEVIREGKRPMEFTNLHICANVEESKALNEDTTPKVIISSSGMCEAGRIRHHLKHNLWRPECTVLFVGYQANGTLGRLLLDGVPRVKLFGEEIAVKARIASFQGMSAHADRQGLLQWLGMFQEKPECVFIVHGEESVCEAFSRELNGSGYKTYAPDFEAEYDLAANRELRAGVAPAVRPAKKHLTVSGPFARLLAAMQRLQEIAAGASGYANKDLAKFADQVISLCDKWQAQPALRKERRKK